MIRHTWDLIVITEHHVETVYVRAHVPQFNHVFRSPVPDPTLWSSGSPFFFFFLLPLFYAFFFTERPSHVRTPSSRVGWRTLKYSTHTRYSGEAHLCKSDSLTGGEAGKPPTRDVRKNTSREACLLELWSHRSVKARNGEIFRIIRKPKKQNGIVA